MPVSVTRTLGWGAGAVTVHVRALDGSPGLLEGARATLSEAELARAARYRFPQDQASFVLRTAWLRVTLGQELGIRPEAVELTTARNGKPALEALDGLRFSCSHSGLIAVVATGRGNVGVDVEVVRPGAWTWGAAERVLSPRELRRVRAARPGDRDRAFYRCWTRREAWSKLDGEGLTESTRDVRTTRRTMGRARMRSFEPVHGVVVSVATAPARPLLS